MTQPIRRQRWNRRAIRSLFTATLLCGVPMGFADEPPAPAPSMHEHPSQPEETGDSQRQGGTLKVVPGMTPGGIPAPRPPTKVAVGRPALAETPSGPSDAATDQPAESKAKPQKKVVATLIYIPPKVGSPGGRVAGGTRDVGRAGEAVLPVLSAIAPEDHAGLTGHEQPIVYWYLSAPTTLPIRFTLTSDRTEQPVRETQLPSPVRSGIQRLPLADLAIRLMPDVTYRWLVTLGPDPAQPTRYSFVGGSIAHVAIPHTLSTKLSAVNTTDVPALYAEEGYWYDTVMAISELIEAAPTDRGLRQQRASLLQQVGLTDVAESDLRQRPK